MRSVAIAALTILCVPFMQVTSAEVLHGVQPLSTFGKIKADFPNGRFQRVKAAWVKEHEAFYSMTGDGFPGMLYLLLDDSRPFWRDYAKSLPPDSPDDAASDGSDKVFGRKWAEGQANESDDAALTIRWVRWVPAAPIPMERVKAKYGEPTRCDFDPADFSPFCSWESRSLSAQTTDDRKSVVFFTAGFTRNELRAAYKLKGSYMPEWLKDDAPTAATPPAKPVSNPARKLKPTT